MTFSGKKGGGDQGDDRLVPLLDVVVKDEARGIHVAYRVICVKIVYDHEPITAVHKYFYIVDDKWL